MKKIWHIIRGFLVFIGFIVVSFAALGVWGLHKNQPALPKRIVVGVTLNGTPEDAPDAPPWLSEFVSVPPTLAEVTDSIYKAAKDARVEALAVRLNAGAYKWPDIQELRSAIDAFKASGKKTYVYSESYGDMSSGMGEYYLASIFDDIWIQPVGGVAITGFHAEMPYFKKVLDLVGIKAEILQKGTYKTAPENVLLETMSQAQRDTIHGILSSMMTDFFDAVSKGRQLQPSQLGPLIDGAPYTAVEAKAKNLVDHVGYFDEFIEVLSPESDKPKHEGKPDNGLEGRRVVDAMSYLYAGHDTALNSAVKKEAQHIEKDKKSNSVALVYVSGMIVSGHADGGGGMLGNKMAYANDIADALNEASDDEATSAIILRVDSPGGSPAASETIRRAVEVAKKRGKYVVVSMGSEAASGGYWISVDADKIYAQQGTLTGSIGVFGGKVSMEGLWDKLSIHWDGVDLGANAAIASTNHPYDEQGRAAVQHMLDDIYDGFVARVAKGRHFAPEVVEAMAQGRVWTGRQAKERGLVDEIGGLKAALEDVAKHAGVPSAEHLDIYQLPDSPSPVQELMGIVTGGVQTLDILKPFMQQAILAANPSLGVTYAPSFAIRY